ncbi:MAG: acyl-CoA dehydrogenase, partial [Betaproteobacteria bacterium]|nr:acyl-CoA dehydrogenase [Betaproteobacteria bacterium]
MDEETLLLLRESLRRFVEREVVPHAAAWEAQGFVPREILRQMGRLGFLGLRYPQAHGGGGLDARATALLAEELGRSTFGGFAITVLVHTDMASPHLVNAGSPEQIKAWLARIISGEAISAVAVTEPDAGSDVKSIRTTARQEGGDWVLRGSKMFITNGALADIYFVAAKTDPAGGSKGLSMFIVEKGMKGFSVGRRLDKMGWRSSDTAELVFEDCRVPAANLLGEAHRGFYSIMKNFQNERIAIGAMA